MENVNKIPSNPMELMVFLSKLPPDEKSVVEFVLQDPMRKVTLDQILKEFGTGIIDTLEKLVNSGLIKRRSYLNFEFFEIPFDEVKYRVRELFPAGPVIPLIYHFNLLSDENRLKGFRKAIEAIVKENDFVLELGTGSGILSLLAARKGAKVYTVEVDPLVADAAEYMIKNSEYSDKITLVEGDVLSTTNYVQDWRFDLIKSIEFDVIICEMLDTALINELQVPIMNFVNENFSVQNAKIIPGKAYTYVQLAYKDYTFEGFNFPLIHYEAYGSKNEKEILSERTLYHKVNFYKVNDTDVSFDITVEVTDDGILNSLILTTDVELYDGFVIGGSDWFNPPMVLPVKAIKVKRGDVVKIKLSYTLGGGFSTIKYKVEI